MFTAVIQVRVSCAQSSMTRMGAAKGFDLNGMNRYCSIPHREQSDRAGHYLSLMVIESSARKDKNHTV